MSGLGFQSKVSDAPRAFPGKWPVTLLVDIPTRKQNPKTPYQISLASIERP